MTPDKNNAKKRQRNTHHEALYTPSLLSQGYLPPTAPGTEPTSIVSGRLLLQLYGCYTPLLFLKITSTRRHDESLRLIPHLLPNKSWTAATSAKPLPPHFSPPVSPSPPPAATLLLKRLALQATALPEKNSGPACLRLLCGSGPARPTTRHLPGLDCRGIHTVIQPPPATYGEAHGNDPYLCGEQ